MSIGKYLSIVSLACVLPLAGCEEEESGNDQDEQTDSAAPDAGGSHDGAVSPADGGLVPGKDGALPGQGNNDAGSGNDLPADGGASTSTGNKFFLPTGEVTNTAAPRLEVDALGTTHMVYPAFFRGDAFYSQCQGDCSDSSKVQAVRFETDGTIYNAMLRLTTDGKPRVLLSGSKATYWAECDSDCSTRSSWRVGQIQVHNGDLSVTGEAMALDPQGRPRFIIHAYRALFGIGQKTPQTSLAQCDADCTKPESWRYDVIAKDEIWEGSSLAYDSTGKAHVATNLFDFGPERNDAVGAYLSCSGTCNAEKTWSGIGFFNVYESMTEAIDMHAAISLALTRDGRPRVAQLGKTPEGKKILAYFACDSQCEGDHWKNGFSWVADPLHDGVDLALDKNDKPRFAHTINYNIALTYCDAADCTAEGAEWNSFFVEKGEDIAADKIFLEWNCTFGAWFLHTPSLALTPDGRPRVGYQIRDVSGGLGKPDPLKPGCSAGTDMTLSRLATVPAYLK